MAQLEQIGRVATKVKTAHGFTTVTYHDTDVVAFDQDSVWLDSGGWHTKTTKTRMNQAANQFGLGFQVYQEKGQWFVVFDGQTLAFRDKMQLYRNTGKSYNVIRFYQRGGKRVIESGLTLEQAHAHCKNPETSSNTCTKYAGTRRTKSMGAWFDGYSDS